jgi:DNA repair protein RadC
MPTALRAPIVKHYAISVQENYTIRDAPVNPAELPDPKLPSGSELRELITSLFPDQPALAERVSAYGIGGLRLIDTPEGAMETFTIDRIAAHRLLAALELGKRLFAPPAGSIPLIRSIEDVYRHCYSLVDRSQEHLHVLLVNNRYQLLHEQTVAIGDGQGLRAQPRDVLQPALERHVHSFVLVHNHPSGDPTPSEADRLFSKHVQEAASLFNIELLDHVVVARNGYASALTPQIQ